MGDALTIVLGTAAIAYFSLSFILIMSMIEVARKNGPFPRWFDWIIAAAIGPFLVAWILWPMVERLWMRNPTTASPEPDTHTPPTAPPETP